MSSAVRVRRSLGLAAATAVALFAAGCSADEPANDGGAPAASESSSPAAVASESAPAAPAPTVSAGTGEQTAATVAEDFPEDLLPVMEDSQVKASSVEPADDLVALSLIAATTASADEVLEYYTEALDAQDFERIGSDSVDGTASQTFIRSNGDETVTVSAVENDDATTYTIGAHLLAESVE